VTPDTPLRLAAAAAIAFPDGSMQDIVLIFSFFAKLSFTQSFTSSHFQKCIVFFEPGIFPFILFRGLPRSAPAHNSAFATDRRSKVNTKF
jgi:hypothetical protein